MLNDSLYSSEKMDWPTPDYLYRALDAEFNFTLDPCASKHNAKCESYFTESDNGLEQKWSGRAFMNPPYGRSISQWVAKARSEVEGGNAELVVCLVPVRSDSKWFHENCMRADEIRLMDQRIEFAGATNKAPFPTCLVIFKKDGGKTRLSRFEVRPLREKYKGKP